MFRGYDTPTQWRRDEILRIRHVDAEIADMRKKIERLKKQSAAIERRIERLKEVRPCYCT